MTDETQGPLSTQRRNILDLKHDKAREFLLKPESYFSQELPSYIVFGDLINNVHQLLENKELRSHCGEKPINYEEVNYTLFHNKDGKYSWRPFQLIHPALYVSLVHTITEEDHWQLICDRFQVFGSSQKLSCSSLPRVSDTNRKDRAEQIEFWWHEIEQRSIEMSLDYEYVIQTDLTDCYGSIYTHSIAWALHTKTTAKDRRQDKSLIGNVIDTHIQDMRHGQTNGIPQGSVLMDFIAEMVLGFADHNILIRLQDKGDIENYHILRYRDDYRVFVNNPKDGEYIVKVITETATDLGLKLNSSKTIASGDVVSAAIKDDKLEWLARKQIKRNLQKHLLIIHQFALKYPNSGSVATALQKFNFRISKFKSILESPVPLIAIVVDIAFRNPRCYSICSAILSKLLSFIEKNEERLDIALRIQKKFTQLPNTGHLQIWLQRVTYPLDRTIAYDEPVCNLVAGRNINLWNNQWISSKKLLKTITNTKIIDETILNEMDPVIPLQEVELFPSLAFYGA